MNLFLSLPFAEGSASKELHLLLRDFFHKDSSECIATLLSADISDAAIQRVFLYYKRTEIELLESIRKGTEDRNENGK